MSRDAEIQRRAGINQSIAENESLFGATELIDRLGRIAQPIRESQLTCVRGVRLHAGHAVDRDLLRHHRQARPRAKIAP